MTTITIAENIDLKKLHFESLEELQTHLLMLQQAAELGDGHKEILDLRLEEAEQSPDNYMTLEDLKSSLRRK